MESYAPFNVKVSTPLLELVGASDELLFKLAPAVRAGKTAADPAPYDDPMSLYEPDPDIRVRKWLQGIWRGRGAVGPDFWRLYLVVLVDGIPVGMQDLIGEQFSAYGSVASFSWLSADARHRGIGREMRRAALHLAFEGFGAKEAVSDAFLDNVASNRVSEALGYEKNGTDWATRQGTPGLLQRWRLSRESWLSHRIADVELAGVADSREALGI